MILLEKKHSITQIEKVLYTAKAHTTGGRDGGTSRSSDGRRLVGLLRIVDQDRGRQNESHATG
jgi:hypothetical protein